MPLQSNWGVVSIYNQVVEWWSYIVGLFTLNTPRLSLQEVQFAVGGPKLLFDKQQQRMSDWAGQAEGEHILLFCLQKRPVK